MNDLFFFMSKLLWFFIEPSTLLFVGLLTGVILLWSRWWRLGRLILALATSFVLVISVFPIGSIAIGELENRFPLVKVLPTRVDGVVVLGGILLPALTEYRDQIAIGGNIERLFAFADLSRRFPGAKLVFTGGTGSIWHAEKKESGIVGKVLSDLGVELSRVTLESESRNTAENAVFTKRLMKPSQEEVWILVTSASHMPRAVGCFRKAGWNIIPYPVDYGSSKLEFSEFFSFRFVSSMRKFDRAIHEWLGLASYRIMGKTDSWFPGPTKAPKKSAVVADN